jgi:hypothetical protein
VIHAALLRAYGQTLYHAPGITIRTGRRCAAADRLLSAHRARAAVFITACNPRSRKMPDGWNQRMQTHLRRALGRCSVVPATGTLRRWSETHFLAFGPVPPLQKLARQYRQNAIVIIRMRQSARLVLTL